MAQHFGKENVFLDVGSIPFGVDFRKYLNEQVSAHDVVLVVIGPDWSRIMQERASQKNDFVRIEIESALQQEKLVIPVLVKNATMPSFADLPASISDLQWRNSASIRRQPDLENDCKRLAEGIQHYAQSILNIAPPAMPAKPKIKPKLSNPTSLDLMPKPFDWIPIPAGQVTLGKGYDNKAHSVGQTFTVDSFDMAKYPVTNAQFAKFIEAGGYDNDSWWTEAGLAQSKEEKWTEPRYWNNSKWNSAEQPVIGISWYEAIAFCLWLSEATGEKISLPSEQQWQRAAQGKEGYDYPWGNQWNRDLCNNNVDKKGIGKTNPLTHYEGKGDSPFGVVDMAGNVWEWCLTEYKTGSELTNGTDVRVLRGGSWFNYGSDYFLCQFRYGYFPNKWGYVRGFRIARSR